MFLCKFLPKLLHYHKLIYFFKKQILIDFTILLDPWPRSEGSYKIGSVHPSVLPSIRRSFHPSVRPSVHLSVSFHRIGSYLVMCDRARFFGKSPHWAKMTENGQKWPKNMVFGRFRKITSLVLSGICVKWKFLWFINILQKLHAWENFGSHLRTRNGSRPMRFQYSLFDNISLID